MPVRNRKNRENLFEITKTKKVGSSAGENNAVRL